jgi:hypothetical protein
MLLGPVRIMFSKIKQQHCEEWFAIYVYPKVPITRVETWLSPIF